MTGPGAADPFLSRLDLLRQRVQHVVEQLRAGDPDPDAREAEAAAELEAKERNLSLHDQRLDAVAEVIKSLGARRVLDLGCGEGKLLRRLLELKEITSGYGDVAAIRRVSMTFAKGVITTIVGSNGVLNRVSEDGVMPDAELATTRDSASDDYGAYIDWRAARLASLRYWTSRRNERSVQISASGAAGDLVGPHLAVHADRLGRVAAGPFGRRAVTLRERGRRDPCLERFLVPPAGHHEPRRPIVGRLQQLETLEALSIVDRSRTGGEPLGEFVAAVSGHGDRVDLHDCHVT